MLAKSEVCSSTSSRNSLINMLGSSLFFRDGWMDFCNVLAKKVLDSPSPAGVTCRRSVQVLGVVRFGRFELSADTGELRKDGVRLKLAGQAIQVLAMLAANPGKLVTREELQQKLWPGASFGDPEHGLNAAVNKLRETLGDSATDPKYIETVPGRGYRFIATLDLHGNGAEPQPQPPKPPWWKRKAAIAIAACVVGAGCSISVDSPANRAVVAAV